MDCPDRPGIVAAVSRFLYQRGANIVHSDQHSTDPRNGAGAFFMRVEFNLPDLGARMAALQREFGAVAEQFRMGWRLTDAAQVKRLAVFVSRDEHALLELLWRQRAGDLRAEIVLVCPTTLTWRIGRGVGGAVPPRPGAPGRKAEAEATQLACSTGQVDVVVLARYMQILSAGVRGALPEPDHQHPPQLPAGLRRRQPLRAGVRARA